jgi:hypothetical protein
VDNSAKEMGTVISAAVEAEWEQYKQLCRQDNNNDGQVKWQTGKKNATSKSNLLHNCFMKMDRPFLKLAPHKIEILHLDPLIVLCRNFVSKAEMEMVKQTANPLVGFIITIRILCYIYLEIMSNWLKSVFQI